MRGDFFFFFTVLLFFFILWVATGGPSRPISFSGPYITPITNTGQTQQGYGSPINFTSGISIRNGANSVGTTIQGLQSQVQNLQSKVAATQTFGTPSTFRGDVTFSSQPYGTLASEQYLTISNTSDHDVTISGWKIESAVTGAYGYIPNGVAVPKLGSVNQTALIVLHPGDGAYVETGTSPIGYSFRENQCTGYFVENQDFNPRLSQNCPTPRDDFERFSPNAKLDDVCYEYVSGLSSCVATSTPPKETKYTNACRSFVANYINYNGCVAAHQNDPYFAGHTWYIYLDSKAQLWKESRDTLKLLDVSGKTVDLFTY